jgi:hypothetical protein
MKDQKNRAKTSYGDYIPMPKEMIFLIGLAVVLFATLVMI